MQNPDLFNRGLALLAFVFAFYTLAARERKTPYLTRSIYSVIWFVFASMILTSLAPLLRSWSERAGHLIELAASVILGVGILYVVFGVWNAYNRHANFRDDGLIKHLKAVRWLKNQLRGLQSGSTYEHHPIQFSDNLIQDLNESQYIESADVQSIKAGNYLSAATKIHSFQEADRILTDLAVRFLEHDCCVQYTVCTRHPIHFVERLKKTWTDGGKRKDWKEIAKQLVVVDAYTPHFGFTDSIYWHRTRELGKMDVRLFVSSPTYAGIHTASAKAFNHTKALNKGSLRQPTLVIYEGPFALVDLESVEQYRIFIRHVLPSERLWASMFTLVLEGDIPEREFETLSLYTDIKLKIG